MADKPRCFLVTVGASVIEKYIERCEVRGNPTDIRVKDIEGLPYERLKKKSKYTRAKKEVSKDIQNLGNFQEFLKSSAELNSLYRIEPKPAEIGGDKIILFTTQTPVGDLCSEILKKTLTDIQIQPHKIKFPDNKIRVIAPEGLGKADDSAFVTEGLPNLISELSKQIQEHEKEYEVILIPTGGYKSIIPYATLAGILHKKEIKYIYEESDKLMTLPPIPVGLDLEQWKPAYRKLDVLTNQPFKNAKPYYEVLDNAFKNLLETPQDEDQPCKFSALGEFLKRRYKELRYRVPLQFQAAGTSLLPYLKRTSDKPDLQKFFSQLVNIGPYLWIGDKAPEMADHALHHHTNLFEIAEILLLPILEKQPDFLKSEELFVLLCTIYFHDWGHVSSTLNGKQLLPTQIRDFHHILGYERLKDREWQKRLIKLGLDWAGDQASEKAAQELWEKYLKLIAIIGLFHRKKMPLKNGEEPYPCPVNKKSYVPLEKQAGSQDEEDGGEGWFLQFEDSNFSNERAILIASLFRVIDSLDNPIARMGTPEEIAMKAAIVRSDAKSEKHRLEEVEKMLKQYLESKSCESLEQDIDKLIGNITGSYQLRESTGAVEKDRWKSEELDLEKEINELIHNNDSDVTFVKSLIYLYINASCWKFFKEEQPRHYLKHLALKNPSISYDNKQGKHIIRVKFQKEAESKIEENCKAFNLDPETVKPDINKVVEKIKEEYTKVKSILEKEGLIFEFEWDEGSQQTSLESERTIRETKGYG